MIPRKNGLQDGFGAGETRCVKSPEGEEKPALELATSS
jgi:hypothetical protein